MTRITFYNHALNLSSGDCEQKHNLSIEPLPNLLTAFFIEKTENEIFVNFFSNPEFGMTVYTFFLSLNREYTFLHVFEDISTKSQYFENP